MRMGNLLGARTVLCGVMSQARPRLGVSHPTVVPANFESASESQDPDDEAARGSHGD